MNPIASWLLTILIGGRVQRWPTVVGNGHGLLCSSLFNDWYGTTPQSYVIVTALTEGVLDLCRPSVFRCLVRRVCCLRTWYRWLCRLSRHGNRIESHLYRFQCDRHRRTGWSDGGWYVLRVVCCCSGVSNHQINFSCTVCCHHM